MYLHQAEADFEKLTMGPDWLFVCFLMYFPICVVISKSWHCPVEGYWPFFFFFLRLLMFVTKPFSRRDTGSASCGVEGRLGRVPAGQAGKLGRWSLGQDGG